MEGLFAVVILGWIAPISMYVLHLADRIEKLEKSRQDAPAQKEPNDSRYIAKAR